VIIWEIALEMNTIIFCLTLIVKRAFPLPKVLQGYASSKNRTDGAAPLPKNTLSAQFSRYMENLSSGNLHLGQKPGKHGQFNY
jgi:hypothetical protein